jgi:hypothetical protein
MGNFQGVWNYGLSQRVSSTTEMEDTYWIDGYMPTVVSSCLVYGASLYIIGLMPVDGCKVGNGINISKQSSVNYKFLPVSI